VHYDEPVGESLIVKVRELYRSRPDFNAWKERIAKEKINYLFLTGKESDGSQLIEKKWAASDPENFHLVFKSEDTEIYSVTVR